MSDAPSLSLHQVVKALEKNGFVLVGRRGSHVCLQKKSGAKLIKIIVPAPRPAQEDHSGENREGLKNRPAREPWAWQFGQG